MRELCKAYQEDTIAEMKALRDYREGLDGFDGESLMIEPSTVSTASSSGSQTKAKAQVTPEAGIKEAPPGIERRQDSGHRCTNGHGWL